MSRDGLKKSFWETSKTIDATKDFESDDFDTIIVGAGITGVTLAKELQNRGYKCLLIEKSNPGFGTTGGTTAHINNFFDSSYDEIISNFGENAAKVLALAAKDTLQYIKKNIVQYHISCDYNECNFFLFSADDKQTKKLDDIMAAHEKVGIYTTQAYEIPFNLPFEKAIEIQGQAQFHPLRYINRLLKEYEKAGGTLLLDFQVTEFENKRGRVSVKIGKNYSFSAKNLVWATHIPPGINRFNILVAPYRSYALTAKLENPPPKMAQTADLYDPYHYIRYHKSNDEYFLIAGGFDHKTGEESDTEKPFQDLEEYVNRHFKFKEIIARWSSQYYVPADGLPYIGKMPGEDNIFISTGYNGNGMTFGTMASLIIPDLLEGKETDLSKLLSPGRVKPIASAKSVISEGLNSTIHFIKDKFSVEKIEELNTIKPGEGRVIKHDNQTIAAYRDNKSTLHLLNPTCSHMGCTIVWNSAEISWDCPCHGSRFDINGKLLTGPALTDLEKI